MSVFKAKGKIVGMTVRPVKSKKDGKEYKIATYFVTDEKGGRPQEVQSFNLGRKVDQVLECEVYAKSWMSSKSGRYGVNFTEISENKAN